MEGLIDKDAERLRLLREIEKIQKNITQFESKLNNPHYVQKAPADVVAQERDRLKVAESTKQKLQMQLDNL